MTVGGQVIRKEPMKTSTVVLILVAIAAIAAGVIYIANRPTPPSAGEPAPGQATQQDTIKLASNEKLGNFLTDGKGMTLYYFSKDVLDKSNCFGQCVTAWPLYFNGNISVGAPLKKDDFGEITRSDGQKMTTYKGWPLYYYFKDVKAGDVLGEGVGNVWFVMKEPFYNTLILDKEGVGNYLTDEKGMALYYFTVDKRGTATTSPQSNCNGQCLVQWPVFYTENLVIPSTMNKADFTTIVRADNSKQLIYKGWPLYYYYLDTKSGDILGDKVGGVWFLVKP